MSYEYTFVPGPFASGELVDELAVLYSGQYGVWSMNAPRNPGKRVKLAPARLREWLTSDSKIALAKFDGQVIGYAIAVQIRFKDYGVISWVTQLVIHEAHRRVDVGKTLLFSIWGFSDHFAWGLVTANPYAIRALEKATRRRCWPGVSERIKLKRIGIEQTTYIKQETLVEVNSSEVPGSIPSFSSTIRSWTTCWPARRYLHHGSSGTSRKVGRDVLQIAERRERTNYGSRSKWSGGEAECDFDKSDLFGNVTLS